MSSRGKAPPPAAPAAKGSSGGGEGSPPPAGPSMPSSPPPVTSTNVPGQRVIGEEERPIEDRLKDLYNLSHAPLRGTSFYSIENFQQSQLTILKLATELAYIQKLSSEGIKHFNEALFQEVARFPDQELEKSKELGAILFCLHAFITRLQQLLVTASWMSGKLLQRRAGVEQMIANLSQGEAADDNGQSRRRSLPGGLFDIAPPPPHPHQPLSLSAGNEIPRRRSSSASPHMQAYSYPFKSRRVFANRSNYAYPDLDLNLIDFGASPLSSPRSVPRPFGPAGREGQLPPAKEDMGANGLGAANGQDQRSASYQYHYHYHLPSDVQAARVGQQAVQGGQQRAGAPGRNGKNLMYGAPMGMMGGPAMGTNEPIPEEDALGYPPQPPYSPFPFALDASPSPGSDNSPPGPGQPNSNFHFNYNYNLPPPPHATPGYNPAMMMPMMPMMAPMVPHPLFGFPQAAGLAMQQQQQGGGQQRAAAAPGDGVREPSPAPAVPAEGLLPVPPNELQASDADGRRTPRGQQRVAFRSGSQLEELQEFPKGGSPPTSEGPPSQQDAQVRQQVQLQQAQHVGLGITGPSKGPGGSVPVVITEAISRKAGGGNLQFDSQASVIGQGAKEKVKASGSQEEQEEKPSKLKTRRPTGFIRIKSSDHTFQGLDGDERDRVYNTEEELEDDSQEVIVDGQVMPIKQAVALIKKQKGVQIDAQEGTGEKGGVKRTPTGFIHLAVSSDMVTEHNTAKNRGADEDESEMDDSTGRSSAKSPTTGSAQPTTGVRQRLEPDGSPGSPGRLVGPHGQRFYVRHGSSVEFAGAEEIHDRLEDPTFDDPNRRQRRGSLIKNRHPTGFIRLSKEELDTLQDDYVESIRDTQSLERVEDSKKDTEDDRRESGATDSSAASGRRDSGGRRSSVTLSSMRPEEIGDLKPGGGVTVSHSHKAEDADVTTADVAGATPVSIIGATGSKTGDDKRDSFWESDRALERHQRIIGRRATGKFTYEDMSLAELEEVRQEAIEIEDEDLQTKLEPYIERRKAASPKK